MYCEICGGKCEWYDGGEGNNYELRVWVCENCGEWQDEETDGDEEEDD
jgi:hypothetical protein